MKEWSARIEIEWHFMAKDKAQAQERADQIASLIELAEGRQAAMRKWLGDMESVEVTEVEEIE